MTITPKFNKGDLVVVDFGDHALYFAKIYRIEISGTTDAVKFHYVPEVAIHTANGVETRLSEHLLHAPENAPELLRKKLENRGYRPAFNPDKPTCVLSTQHVRLQTSKLLDRLQDYLLRTALDEESDKLAAVVEETGCSLSLINRVFDCMLLSSWPETGWLLTTYPDATENRLLEELPDLQQVLTEAHAAGYYAVRFDCEEPLSHPILPTYVWNVPQG